MFELGLFACVCKKGVFKGRHLRVLSDLHCLSLFSKAVKPMLLLTVYCIKLITPFVY